MKHVRSFVALAVAALVLAACGGMQAAPISDEIALASVATYTETWDARRGLNSERCDYLGQEGRTAAGWIHWVFSTKGESTGAVLTLGGTGSGTYQPGEPLNANVWHFYTPFFELAGLTARIDLFGGDKGTGGGLVISDWCAGNVGRTIAVSKTAEPTFKRTHDWSVTKSVDPEALYLFTDGSGDATVTYTVDVEYLGYDDSHHNVSGEILITNISNDELTKTIASIVDDLGVAGFEAIELVCDDVAYTGQPLTVAFGDTITCTYSVNLTEEQATSGTNTVTVTVDGETEPYEAVKAWAFGDPTTEVNATVDVKDYFDGGSAEHLGQVTAPNDRTFTYTRDFAWADYGAEKCGDHSYRNVVKLFGDDKTLLDSDEASLDVYVQCFVYETAYAKAENGQCFSVYGFARWGWTNRIDGQPVAAIPVYAGAAQCDVSKGTLVGTFSLTFENGAPRPAFDLGEDFVLRETHVYLGANAIPQVRQGNRMVGTVAPGQYTMTAPYTWLIAHAVVGLPDPNFGPAAN